MLSSEPSTAGKDFAIGLVAPNCGLWDCNDVGELFVLARGLAIFGLDRAPLSRLSKCEADRL